VIIVARGGGSFEDLFCFNDEGLVRAIADSPVPVISAVGHETDYTLCDFVADVRAGTPSIAAEIAVPEKKELLKRLTAALSSVTASLRGKYENQSQRIDHLSDRLAYSLRERADSCARKLQRSDSSLALQLESMRSRCAVHFKTISACSGSLLAALNLALERKRARLEQSAAKLSVLSPYSVLDRGYSLTTDSSGAIIKSADAVAAGDEIVTRFKTGEIRSVVRSRGLGDRSQE
jgi:exodeoxyribonuclease VII large subunit